MARIKYTSNPRPKYSSKAPLPSPVASPPPQAMQPPPVNMPTRPQQIPYAQQMLTQALGGPQTPQTIMGGPLQGQPPTQPMNAQNPFSRIGGNTPWGS